MDFHIKIKNMYKNLKQKLKNLFCNIVFYPKYLLIFKYCNHVLLSYILCQMSDINNLY